MSKKQLSFNPVAHKTIFIISILWSFIALDFVAADEPYYVYPSDVINAKKKTNNTFSEQEKWRYSNEIPSRFQASSNSDPIRYTYLPPVQEPGSNPFTNPQRTYQQPLKSNAETDSYVTGTHYSYPPPAQKPGTNPITNPQRKYQFPANRLHDSKSYMAGKQYNYPPSSQKIGTNPFLNPNLQDDPFIKKLIQRRSNGNMVSY
ncbi:MAG: hypothetical protein QNL62_24030 [Gammaproteobacteria bacterium]|nr:hypothetical protein [Gammaproteobacteria bacterium]